ncbi:MAG: hypothetical protein H0W15_01420 [Gemmatimonadales bacterium]|nr:hypothetical protein [Gemmatimonadales bacterium]
MLDVLLIVAGGVLFYRIGDHDYGAGFVTAGLSVLFGVVALFAFAWGPGGYLAGQVVLFACLTGYNMRRQARRGSDSQRP